MLSPKGTNKIANLSALERKESIEVEESTKSPRSTRSSKSHRGSPSSKSHRGSPVSLAKYSRTRRYTILGSSTNVDSVKKTEFDEKARHNLSRDPYHITAQEWEALRYSMVGNHLAAFHIYELRSLSTGSLRNLWNKYDPKQNGELNRYATMNFAKNCVDILIEHAELDLYKKEPKLKESALQHRIEEQLPRILPGTPSTKKEGTEHMWSLIAATFDPFDLGIIRRENFMKKWHEFAETCLFHETGKINPLRCSIL